MFGDYQSGGNVGSQGPACGSEGPSPAESFGVKTQLDSDKDCGFESTHTPADDKLFTQLVQVGTTDFHQAELLLAKLVKEKKFDGNVVQLGMEKGAIDFVYNDKLKNQIPETALQAVEEAKANILSGKLVAPKDKF